MPIDREQLRLKIEFLASKGVHIGTSSWKYQGWMDQLYTRERYQWRGKVSTSRFEQNSLEEYAEVFSTVCVDAAYYVFPRRESLQKLADQVPDGFQFGFKVTDTITIKKFPNLPRFGVQAGRLNPDYLNADLFHTAFLAPCESILKKVGVIMFEFSRFWPSDYEHGRDFLGDLDRFLGKLPKDWPYAIELRNQNWLHEDYFRCLAEHRVTHVFNSWSAMPPVSEQMLIPQSRTNPSLVAARFLLRPGREYAEAVKAFQPYNQIKEVNDEARKAGAALIQEGVKECVEAPKKTFIFINNRLEGNALSTIEAMMGLAMEGHGANRP